jgi:hypothetical protein
MTLTANHHLVYRLAELMLQQQQHAFLVDVLFDDEQIGELVKNIQIDSPYQQLLLNGVCTESIREEQLYVSFTTEAISIMCWAKFCTPMQNKKGKLTCSSC